MSTPASPSVRRAEPSSVDKKADKPEKVDDQSFGLVGTVVRTALLIGICYVAYTIRLHAVNVYGRVIHEVRLLL